MSHEINLTPTGSLFEIAAQSNSGNGARSGNSAGNESPDAEKVSLDLAISARSWGTASECRAACLLVHGLGAHSGWFEALARRLKVRQLYAVAYDQVGFGRRSKQPFASGKQWLDDAERAYHYVKEQTGDKPVYLLGNSMGALVALKMAQRLKPEGVVLFSPGFDGHPKTFDLIYRLKAIWTALVSPETELALPYTVDMVTREPSVRKWLEADPDRRFRLPAKMLLELLKLSQDVQSRVKTAPCPVLMFTAGIEKIVNNDVNEAVFSRLSSPAKQKVVYEEAWHDLMFDPVIDQLAEKVSQWIVESSPEKLNVS